MAHQVETMAFANEVPWHGLGARVDGDLMPEEMLKAAGLNWRVNMLPMKALAADGKLIDVKNKFAAVRDTDNRVMTTAGHGWNPVQNEEILEFMRDYVSAGGATLETAGSLRNGQVVWGLANINNEFEVTPGDKVKGYLLIKTSHVVGAATTIRLTTVRVVCANTMAYAEQGTAPIYRQNHMSVFNSEAAKAAVAGAHEGLANAEKRAKRIKALKLSMEDALRQVYFPVLMPKVETEISEEIIASGALPASITSLLTSYARAPGADAGTGWGALNGYTHYADHILGHNAGTRMFRSWAGDTGKLKLKIEKKLLELAE
jgi:phage/plasmid-like protein (TIGR03299 family)